MVAAPEQFRVTRGQDLMAYYRGEGTSVRTFCRRCGSCLYTEVDRTYHVSAGILDDLAVTPAVHASATDSVACDELATPVLPLT